MDEVLAVHMPGLHTPRVEMSRLRPQVVLETFLQPPRPGAGLTVHAVAEVSGGLAADRAGMVQALAIADPALRPLPAPSEKLRAHVRYRLDDLPSETQVIFRFAAAHGIRLIWGRMEGGIVVLHVPIPPGESPQVVAGQLRDLLGSHRKDVRVSLEPVTGDGLARARELEAVLAQARGQAS